MPNVLTSLAADIYVARDRVARELTGFIPASMVNAGASGAAVGQTVRSHFTRSVSTATFTPSMTIPEGTDQTIDNKTLTITKQKGVQIPWTGEDVKFVNGGIGWETIYGDQIYQAMRAIVNEIEIDLATEAYTNASRATGTAGTTPFAANFNTIAATSQILRDNGMWANDGTTSLIMNTLAGTNLRNLAQLQKVNEGGGDDLLRRGILLDLQGVLLRESAGVVQHTAGGATGGLINNASGEVVGQTALTLDTITVNTTGYKAGDIITGAADTVNAYVINTGLVAVSGDIVIGAPGLRATLPDNNAITVGGSYAANVMMRREALELAIRAPATPFGGDAAVDSMIVQDPMSGLSFEISVYKGFKKAMMMVAAVWGYKAWKPEGIAILRG